MLRFITETEEKTRTCFFKINLSIIRTIISFAFIAALPNIIKPEFRQQLEAICDEIKQFPKVEPKKKNESSPGPSSGNLLLKYQRMFSQCFSVLTVEENIQESTQNQKTKNEPVFLEKCLAILCGVISPRSLNGLNHMNLDNDFHIANQEQNISKFK